MSVFAYIQFAVLTQVIENFTRDSAPQAQYNHSKWQLFSPLQEELMSV